jgi:mannose-6-phosphate isomerase-like protein (cupin superfamily)
MKTMKATVVRESNQPWEGWTDPAVHAKSPIRWKLLVGGERTPSKGLTVGIAEIPPGRSLLRHHHAPQEVYYVIEGEGQTEIAGTVSAVGPGTALFIPPNARHRTVNTGTVPLRFVWIFPTDTFQEIQYHYDE